jgi:hypothetical protein
MPLPEQRTLTEQVTGPMQRLGLRERDSSYCSQDKPGLLHICDIGCFMFARFASRSFRPYNAPNFRRPQLLWQEFAVNPGWCA